MKTKQAQQHTHDENCGCGCHDGHHHHQHEHHGESEHQHGPEHHHDHSQPITITTHDMSIVGSYAFSIEKKYDEAQLLLDQMLKQVAKEVENSGGIIGHIKAFLKADGESCMISITEEESNKRYLKAECCKVEGVAIVFGIKPEQLKSILTNAFKAYISQ